MAFSIHVSYGVLGLKTHCKVLLVVRQDHDGLHHYVHAGTGNYHPETARIYVDIGLLTADPVLGHDVNELFNYLTTGYGPSRAYRKLIPGPAHLKRALLERIERERGFGSAGLIQFKMNALEDADITRALYSAAQAVPIEDAAGRKRLRAVLDLQLAPNRNAWTMQADASYLRAEVDGRDRGSQQALLDWLTAEYAHSLPRRRRRAGYARRPAVSASA